MTPPGYCEVTLVHIGLGLAFSSETGEPMGRLTGNLQYAISYLSQSLNFFSYRQNAGTGCQKLHIAGPSATSDGLDFEERAAILWSLPCVGQAIAEFLR